MALIICTEKLVTTRRITDVRIVPKAPVITAKMESHTQSSRTSSAMADIPNVNARKKTAITNKTKKNIGCIAITVAYLSIANVIPIIMLIAHANPVQSHLQLQSGFLVLITSDYSI